MIGLLNKKNLLLVVIILIALGLTGCSDSFTSNIAPVMPGTFPVDPVFDPLVQALGGLASPAITPMGIIDGVYYQYTQSYLLAFNPNAPANQQYYLFPLGNSLDLIHLPGLATNDAGGMYVNGYRIWDELVAIYNKYGTYLIGPPLTGLLYNSEQDRYEQYFQNMGFYQYADGRDHEVRMLPYGVWICASDCPNVQLYFVKEFNTSAFSLLVPATDVQQANQTFRITASRLGMDFTGAPLSDAYQASDGMYEKVFENIVMYIDPQALSRVRLRRLPQTLGVVQGQLATRSEDPDMYFFPVQDSQGYNIPQAIFDFISAHGTSEVSGAPITQMQPLDNGAFSQCFEHLCLEYRPKASTQSRVRVLPLGRDYVAKGIPQLPPTAKPAEADRVLNVKVWERYPLLPPNQAQDVGVAVFENVRPLSGVSLHLSLILPDGNKRLYVMNPTDANGQTWIRLDPVDLPNGTVVPYQVCLSGLTEPAVCIEESFVVWQGN